MVLQNQVEITSEQGGLMSPCRIRVNGKFFARGMDRLRLRGVTYGPFAPNTAGEPFPEPGRVRQDLARMARMGVNSLRTYYVPPAWFLDLTDEYDLSVVVDVPWSKHLCFLDSDAARREARQAVCDAARLGCEHGSLLACSIGNEIPPDIVRWHGAPRVERFLAELGDVAKQANPDGLVTYANFPSTEYLELPFLDFHTFNVYLHDPEEFRRYLLRLQNLTGDKPLILGEIGMDTLRHGEAEQAAFLAGHLREATLMGLAGAFVFSWTDDWFTGGYQIEDWAFGVTRADRSPKASLDAVGDVFTRSPAELLTETPRVSVVVCSYNGGQTLAQCLRSLLALDYPDYEVILVDDGSTDNTREIAARFPQVHTIHQKNQGLSFARNIGLGAATGAIIAYTDSDCFADPDWLTHLVYQLQRTGASAVGGPNLTPEDGRLAACIAASPGQPTHVLEGDQVAEHIPGCNMAYRREALEAIGGFDPTYRKAGDDVDVCWRLQMAGGWITFAPSAFVWHHRRQNPRTYLRQQAGYGEAEALLWFAHPERFNSRGESKWRGALYGSSLAGLRLGGPVIFRGPFGTGLFQTLYQPGVAHWATLPSTLEWHVAAAIVATALPYWPFAGVVVAAMLTLSLSVALLLAAQAPLEPKHRSLRSRLAIAALSYVQPLVRSWWRYRTRFFRPSQPPRTSEPMNPSGERMPLHGSAVVEYWDEAWRERTALLQRINDFLDDHQWVATRDAGWSEWDMEIRCHPWTSVRICTVQEDHGSGKRLFRVRYRLHPSAYTKTLGALGVIAAGTAAVLHAPFPAVVAGALIGSCVAVWLRGISLASQAMGMVDTLAREMKLIRCWKPSRSPSPKATKDAEIGR